MDTNQNASPPKILIVDDIPANLVAMEHLLKNAGVEPIKANGGFEALDLTLKHQFFLVLLDVQMPEIDGYETAQMLQSHEHSKDIPIIFVTANSTEEHNIMRGYDVGAVDYITKPVNKAVLLSKVKIFKALYQQRESLKQLNEKLAQSRNAAEKANQVKSEFLANISHELRTPMHAIMGFSEIGIMNIEGWSKPEQVDNLRDIYNNGKHLLELINDLLDLAKLEAKRTVFSFAKSDIPEIFEDVVRSLKALLSAKNIQIDAAGLSSACPVECDPHKIRQVITNLISNAVKFSPENKTIYFSCERVTLRAGRRATDTGEVEAMAFSVRDEGIGIPEDELETIFDKFIQSSKTKSGAGGTGLGLAICKEILGGHRGTIYAQNDDGGHAVFTFTLPLTQPYQASEQASGGSRTEDPRAA